ITGPRTMLQEAVDRILPLFPYERIWVITNRSYLPLVREQVPALPEHNLIGEIMGRGTAPAIGLAAMLLRRQDPEAVMVVLTADHLIRRREQFVRALSAAVQVAQKGHLVTLGIEPRYPETGYGYIEQGELLYHVDGFGAYRVVRFTEKPDRLTAQEFITSGRYVWNSGMFIWRVEAILAEMARQMPVLYAQLQEIVDAWGTPAQEETLQRVWPAIQAQTIDFGVMEHARDVVVIPVDIGWSDIGSWAALLDILPADEQGNVLAGDVEALDTRNSFIYSAGRLIAVIGLNEMIVVDAGDALLICPRDRAQDVKHIVEQLKERGRLEYL
ncbi:MAG: mannose-1-phosphate guanyltransferase, partial [Anaerolineae bacterium]|nr:mannose-1-phosphate guanyltransferase [Anaerolineae bacterium]